MKNSSRAMKFARYVYFFSDCDGVIQHDPDLSAMFAIESVVSINFAFAKCDQLRRTSKAFRSPRPGYAYLVADTQAQLERDYLLLREAEKNLYVSLLHIV